MDRLNLLVIDDDPNIRNLLTELLRGRPDLNLLIAANGPEAVTHFASSQVDLVLTDIHMPGFTGLELMTDMKKINFKPEILVMTANATPENVETARRIGARSVILKPFDDLEVIEAEINKAASAARAARGQARGSAPAPPAPHVAPAAVRPAPAQSAGHAPAARGKSAAPHVPETTAGPPSPAAPASPPVHEAPEESVLEIPVELDDIVRAATRFDAGRMRMQVPIICLQTWEEEAAVATLRRLAASQEREFYLWSEARGLLKDGGQPMGEMYREPSRALEFIRRQKNNGLYVLADFRGCLDDRMVVRALREMVMEYETARGLLVLTSPRLPLPPELAQVGVTFDWPAGGSTDYDALYEEVAAEVMASSDRAAVLALPERNALLKRVKGMPAGRVRFEIARALMGRTK